MLQRHCLKLLSVKGYFCRDFLSLSHLQSSAKIIKTFSFAGSFFPPHLFLNTLFVSVPLSGLFLPASPSSTRKEGRDAVAGVSRLGNMARGRLELAMGSFCFFLDLWPSLPAHVLSAGSHLFVVVVVYFNWRVIALQYCVSLCHTSTWISHRYT